MATNFTLTTTARLAAPVMAGAFLASRDQAPTGAWIEVEFGAVGEITSAMQTRERVVHISTDTALRFFVGAAAPAGGATGAQVLAGTERTIAFGAADRLWIRS